MTVELVEIANEVHDRKWPELRDVAGTSPGRVGLVGLVAAAHGLDYTVTGGAALMAVGDTGFPFGDVHHEDDTLFHLWIRTDDELIDPCAILHVRVTFPDFDPTPLVIRQGQEEFGKVTRIYYVPQPTAAVVEHAIMANAIATGAASEYVDLVSDVMGRSVHEDVEWHTAQYLRHSAGTEVICGMTGLSLHQATYMLNCDEDELRRHMQGLSGLPDELRKATRAAFYRLRGGK